MCVNSRSSESSERAGRRTTASETDPPHFVACESVGVLGSGSLPAVHMLRVGGEGQGFGWRRGRGGEVAGVVSEGAVVLKRVGMGRVLGVQLVEQLECLV